MNERVGLLRKQSVEAVPHLTGERARLITAFYRSPASRGLSVAVRRAEAFRYILENKAICINPGELLVGERGPAPKATPTYPEITAHSSEDLRILDSRPKTSYKTDPELIKLYEEEILPFWAGSSLREMLMQNMTPEWHACFEAGVFTEFMEQRAPGHTVLGDRIYRMGMLDMIAEIEAARQRLDFLQDREAYRKNEELKAMAITARTLIRYGERHAEAAEESARAESNPVRREELLQIAGRCRRVPAHAPRTFAEALQYYWFVHLGVITELNPWDAFNPGRLDQHLWPFYRDDLAAGRLSREQARELLCCFWIKFNNQPAPPKVGVTAQESGTYTDFANINVGGLRHDGTDGVTELSFLILDVIEEMRLLQPSSNIQLSRKNPDAFLLRTLEILKTGFGQPSIFNADAICQEMMRQGKSLEDARTGGASGCVEAGIFGKESYILTGYFNLPKVLEITLHDGIDPRTGQRLGPATGDPARFRNMDSLLAAFQCQLDYFIGVKIRGNAVIERLYAEYLPVPFLSLLIDDCIIKGKDYHDGGARYDTSYIQGVGIGTITDTLSSLSKHVFDDKTYSMNEMLDMLAGNFDGREEDRQYLMNKTPRYGNDDPYADGLMRRVFDLYYQAVNGRPTTRGGTYRINMLPTTCHVYFGKMTMATADGRHAHEPLSEGISPVQGADRLGPTAVIKSAARMDHLRTGGTLLNMKFLPQLMEREEDLVKIARLVRTYFSLDGHHIQFNVVQEDTLRKAQQNPARYRDLIVRVAGYSDYFVDLAPELQEEIIRRTAHTSF